MSHTQLTLTNKREVTLCGTNVYPAPEMHPDRVMQEHDLLYIYSGEQGVAQDDESYTLQAGDLIFLRAGSHHYGSSPTARDTRTMFIHFNRLPGDAALDPPYNCKNMDVSNDNDGAFMLPTMLHIGQDTPATQLFNEIISCYWGHAPNKRRRCTLLLNLLLDELSVIASTFQHTEEKWGSSLISLFKQNPSRMYSLEELAEQTGMNPRTLSARFRQVTGESIHQYQLNLKLESAYRQLRTGCTVKEVAMSLGFCDAYYFSRQFKKKFGVTPKEIKQRDPRTNINRTPVV